MLDDPGREARRAAAALHAFIALADAGAQAAEVGGVASAPGPASGVRGVGVAQVVAAGLAEPDFVGAVAGGAEEGVCGEGVGRGLGSRDAVEARGRGCGCGARRAFGIGAVFDCGWIRGGVEGERDGETGPAEAPVSSW